LTQLETILPSMATLMQRTQNQFNGNVNLSGDDLICASDVDDFVEIKMGTKKNPRLIICDVPVYDNESSSWRLECTRDGTYLKMSLVNGVSSKINDFIDKVGIFQETTIFGNPKKSLSSRGASKFKIPINSRCINTQTNETCFRTPTLLVDYEYRIYEIVVDCKNYEHTSHDLRHLLDKHYQHKFGARDELGLMDENFLKSSVIYKLKIEYANNDNFIRMLFKKSR